mgnify:CR=1 FL=1
MTLDNKVLEIGDAAPDFELKDQNGNKVQLSSFKGNKNVVVLFIPFSFTGTCTSELCAIRDDLAAFSGTSPETVSRTLSDFKEEGLIEKTFAVKFRVTPPIPTNWEVLFDELIIESFGENFSKEKSIDFDYVKRIFDSYKKEIITPREIINFINELIFVRHSLHNGGINTYCLLIKQSTVFRVSCLIVRSAQIEPGIG